MARRLLILFAVVPVIGATAAAGIISAPSKTRPCVTEFSNGFTGGPTHADLGPGGALWVNEGRNDKIARFDVRTKTATEFPVPKGTQLHDLATGPDGNLWFSGFNGPLGRFDVKTHKVTIFPRRSPGSQPHLWWTSDDQLYFGDIVKGRLGHFDPRTKRITESRYNLPRGSGIHGFVPLPDGSAWWGLQYGDQLAHFDPRKRRFDKFVKLPKGSGPHWLVYVPRDHAIWVLLQYANRLARYDLETDRVATFDLTLDPITPADIKNFKPVPALTFGLVDAQGDALWMATLAGGEVIRFDLKTHDVTKVGCGLTFPSQTINLANDRAGDLWVTVSPPSPSQAGSLGKIAR